MFAFDSYLESCTFQNSQTFDGSRSSGVKWGQASYLLDHFKTYSSILPIKMMSGYIRNI